MSVLTLTVPPKERRFDYRGFAIRITFDPPTRKWTWVAEKPVTHVVTVCGSSGKTVETAHAYARRKIDTLLG